MKSLALVLAGVLALTGEAPAPASIPRYPQAVATDLGSLNLLTENDTDSAISGVQIFLGAGLDKESLETSGIAALVADCVLRTPVPLTDGTSLPVRDAITAQGGSLQYTVDGSTVHFYVEGRSEKLPALVTLLGKALAAPDFSPATVSAARRSLGDRIGELQGNALSVGIEMFRHSYYATGAGLPALGSTTTLAALHGHDLTAFYQQNYKRSGLIASAVGTTGPALAEALRGLAAALPAGTSDAVPPKSKPIPENAPRIVAHRDVGAPIIVVGYQAPGPGTRDFGAMVVLESLLSNAFERSSTTTLGIAERSVGAFYLYDSMPASLVVYVNGTRVDPSLALRELLLVSKSLAARPLTPGALQRFKTQAAGQFVMDSVSVSDRAYLLGTFAAHGLGPDGINAALNAIDATTPADLQRVAKQYLQRYIVALVLPRQNG